MEVVIDRGLRSLRAHGGVVVKGVRHEGALRLVRIYSRKNIKESTGKQAGTLGGLAGD
jgi:hypothetical protein